MKTCPFCAEEIQDAAIVCKHCGRELIPLTSPGPTPPVPAAKKVGVFTWVIVGFVILTFTSVVMKSCGLE